MFGFEWPPELVRAFQLLTDRDFWVLVGLALLGVFMFVAGLVMMASPSAVSLTGVGGLVKGLVK